MTKVAATDFLALLSNEKRLSIASILLEEEISVGDLARRVGLSQSALSQHLAKMRGLGVVQTRRHHQTIFYSSDSSAARAIVSLAAMIDGAC